MRGMPLEAEGVNDDNTLEVEEGAYVLVAAAAEVVVVAAALYKQVCISYNPQHKCGGMMQGNKGLCGNTCRTFCLCT